MKTKHWNCFGLGLFLVLTIPILPTPAFSAEKLCKDKIAAQVSWTEHVPRFVAACADFVKKEKRVPTQEDLAKVLKLSNAQVRAFFQDRATPHGTKELLEQARIEKPEVFADLRLGLIKKAARFMKETFRMPLKQELAEMGETTPQALEAIYGDTDDSFWEDVRNEGGSSITTLRNKIMTAFSKVARAKGRVPTVEEVVAELKSDTPVDAFLDLVTDLKLFESWEDLKTQTMLAKPGSFKNFTDTDFFNKERLEALQEAVRARKRLIVVTAVAGSVINQDFFDSLLHYSRRNDAEIVVLPANMQTTGLDPKLLNTAGVHVLTNELLINPWLTLSRIKVLAKQINPTMGTKRLLKRGQMVVIGSPKMHLDAAATKNNSLSPHRVVTTGAITVADYNSGHYQGLRTDYLAEDDHVMGALILEKSYGQEFTDLKTSGFFHARHVEFIPEQKGFMDLGTFYTANKVRKVRHTLVLGDIHVGDTDERLMQSLKEQLLKLRPKYVVLHDLLNGYSISPHERDNIVRLSDKAKNGDLNLRDEIRRVVNFVDAMMSVDPEIKIVIVPSNHDYWLHRWLKEARYAKEPQNAEIGAQLFLQYHRGVDPFKAVLTDKEMGVQNPKRLIFLDIGKSFAQGHADYNNSEANRLVELALHGHEGANGAKLSLQSMQEAVDRGVYGHTHTYARRNGVVNVGTITLLDLSYNRGGFSNWIQAAALVGPHGEIQALEFKEGEWFHEEDGKSFEEERFFPPDYPRALDNPGPVHEGHIDQWSRKK